MKPSEWAAVTSLVLVLFAYQSLLGVDGVAEALGDEKGLSGIFLVFPLTAYGVAMLSAYRWGFRWLRIALITLGTFGAFWLSVPSAFDPGDPADLFGIGVYIAGYSIPALAGEFSGALIRRLASRPTRNTLS